MSKLSIHFLEGLPPLRWFISTFIPLSIAVWGYTKRSLNLSGALLGECSNQVYKIYILI